MHNESGSPGDPIARQDEVLELLYWFEGEKIAGVATVAAMSRFLTYSENEIRDVLDRLIARGDVAPANGENEYRLTETGRQEAARRFAEEFAAMLAQGHGECNDPNCDCHANPAAAADCHARVHHPH